LIVGDVEHRQPQLHVQPFQLQPHLLPESGVEVRQGLVEKKQRRLSHDGPSQGDPLLLTSGQLVGIPLRVLRHIAAGQRIVHAFGSQVPRHSGVPERVLDVLVYRHVGPDGVGLEDHSEFSLLGRHCDAGCDVIHHPPRYLDCAGRRGLDTGDHP
jgi:hypothetical protein